MPVLPVVGGGNPARAAGEIESLLARGEPDGPGARTLHGLAVAIFQAGPAGEPYFEAMARAFAAAAGAGHVEAWIELGRCRWNGWGTPRDPELAVAAFRRAADAGSLEGAFLAAANLGHGLGRWEEARLLAKRAMELGDGGGDARTLLARMAFHGLGGEPADPTRAVSLLESAVAAGNPDAMMELSLLLAGGRGVPADAARSRELLLEAATRGHPLACTNVGAAYATGAGGFPRSASDAVLWYERASASGSGRASVALAVMFGRGQGVPRDEERAERYLARAQEQGVDLERWFPER